MSCHILADICLCRVINHRFATYGHCNIRATANNINNNNSILIHYNGILKHRTTYTSKLHVHCIVYSVFYTLYTVQCTVHTQLGRPREQVLRNLLMPLSNLFRKQGEIPVLRGTTDQLNYASLALVLTAAV